MIKAGIAQNSDLWRHWRNHHIGASDVPIIIGKSKWCSAYELWKQKVGFSEGFKGNWATERGQRLEPMVLSLVNDRYNLQAEPVVVVHEELEWASASLDGLDEEKGIIVEIKVPGLADHQKSEQGEVPEHYYPQVQWQLFVTGLEVCYYVSYYENDFELVEVERDDAYIKDELLEPCAEFMRCVKELDEPPKSEDDFTTITDPAFQEYARKWLETNEMLHLYKDKENYYRNKLLEFTDDGNCEGYGVRITRIERKGAIDWQAFLKKIEEAHPEVLKEIDPESFRKEQIGYPKVTAK
jgi:putative phage-type endonuclease